MVNQTYKMIDTILILLNESSKILFLLIPVLISVAMIVWLDSGSSCPKKKRTNVVGPFGLLQTTILKYIFKEIIILRVQTRQFLYLLQL